MNAKTIALSAALAAAAFAPSAHAQDKVPSNPSTTPAPTQLVVSAEVDARNDQINARQGVPFVRGQIEYGPWFVRYDAKTNLASQDKLVNVAGVFHNAIVDAQDTKVGAGILSIGNHGRETEYWATAWAEQRVRALSLADSVRIKTEVGASARASGAPRYFNITRISHPHFTLEEGVLSQQGFFRQTSPFWWAAAHNDHLYAAAGKEVGIWHAFAGIHGFKDFGTFNFWQYNPQTGDFWIKSQTGIGNASKGFYSIATFNDATSYLTVPPFFQRHFSPLVTKGDNTIKIEARGGRKGMSLETMFGKRTDVIDIGAGVLVTWSGDVQRAEPVLELYKGFEFGNFKGFLEGRYVRNNAGLYAQGQYTL